MSCLGALAAALLLAGGQEPVDPVVQVRVLERLHPREAMLSGPADLPLSAGQGRLLASGQVAEQPLLLPDGAWRIALPGRTSRSYRGSLSVRSVEGELRFVLALPLERYVAQVVAAESLPGTPEQALRALAVVVRSFVLAQGRRHDDAEVCDLSHCQLFRGTGVSPELLASARAAASATRGQVLVLSSGRVAEALFHAACGGHTADPAEVLGSSGTGAAAVADPGCPVEPWEAELPLGMARSALAPLLGPRLLLDADPLGLQVIPGTGGYALVVVERATGRAASGDAVARALDRALGWGRVRSGRFRLEPLGARVRVHGSGLGHGLGLCQAGAARLAARGESHRAILAHYFPLAVLTDAAALTGLRRQEPERLPTAGR